MANAVILKLEVVGPGLQTDELADPGLAKFSVTTEPDENALIQQKKLYPATDGAVSDTELDPEGIIADVDCMLIADEIDFSVLVLSV